MDARKMFDLSGKVAIVTGGGRGIGYQMALGLAEAGANVVLCSRKVEICQEAAKNLARLGIQAIALQCDVKSPENIQRVVDTTLQQFNRVDILVNNSGANWAAPPEEYPLEGWQKVLETNVTGVFLFCQIVGRAMIRAGGGSIINVSSVMGLVGTEAEAADAIGYSTSKGAVIAFTKDLAAKWAKYQIRVNTIAPGWFPTDMTRVVLEQHGKKMLGHIPMGRFGGEDELKGAAVFLASAAARYITGIVLPVDGGYMTI